MSSTTILNSRWCERRPSLLQNADCKLQQKEDQEFTMRIILTLIFILCTVVLAFASFDTRCNVCICYHYGVKITMDCRNQGLNTLPLIDKFDTLSLKEVYMNGNNITRIEANILLSWDLLSYIDLRDNPIICSELLKIPKQVTVLTDCLHSKTG